MNVRRLLHGCVWIAGFLFVLDRIAKWLVITHIAQPIPLTPFFYLDYAINRGISCGLFYFTDTVGFVVVSSIIAALLSAIMVWTWRVYQRGGLIIGQLLIISGGLSNLCDRVLFGGVVDYLGLHWGEWCFPLFNIADVAIDVGVVILIVQNMAKK